MILHAIVIAAALGAPLGPPDPPAPAPSDAGNPNHIDTTERQMDLCRKHGTVCHVDPGHGVIVEMQKK